MKFRLLCLLVCVGIIFNFFSCKKGDSQTEPDEEDKVIESLTVTPSTITIDVGEEYSLQAVILPQGIDNSLTWTSDSTNIVSVSATGKITGISEGSGLITAAYDLDNNFIDTCSVLVIDSISSSSSSSATSSSSMTSSSSTSSSSSATSSSSMSSSSSTSSSSSATSSSSMTSSSSTSSSSSATSSSSMTSSSSTTSSSSSVGYNPALIPVMKNIPGGTFMMGSNENDSGISAVDEGPTHSVTISAFYIGETEVSYIEWTNVYQWAIDKGYVFNTSGDAGVPNLPIVNQNHPAVNMEWYDILVWCNALSAIEGLSPCYYHDDGHTLLYSNAGPQDDIANSKVDWTADGYRLPTEAEWEYACRAGTATRYHFGNTVTGSDANFLSSGDPFDDGTTPVRYYTDKTNAFGLYDMHGNAAEWCWDGYSSGYYSISPSNDPRGPVSVLRRVQRGGVYSLDSIYMRSAERFAQYPYTEEAYQGFRLVRSQ